MEKQATYCRKPEVFMRLRKMGRLNLVQCIWTSHVSYKHYDVPEVFIEWPLEWFKHKGASRTTKNCTR